jgi:branched-chain amino acid transport system permease protein
MVNIPLQVFVNGLLMGGIYAMAAIGLTLIWGVMNFINFASGQMTMFGMYITLILAIGRNLDPVAAVMVAMIIMFAMGLFVEKIVIEPIADSPRLFQIVVSIAMGLILENLAFMIWGAEIKSMPKSLGSMKFLSKVIDFGLIRLSPTRLMPLPAAIILTISLHYFLTRTRIGLGIRGVAQNTTAAYLMGIDVRKAYTLTWGLGVSFMGLAGGFLMLFQPAYPAVGLEFILISFIAVTLGGAGSYIGTFIGSIVMGVVEALSGFFLFPALRQVVYLSLFVIMLFIRPTGLFPTKEAG